MVRELATSAVDLNGDGVADVTDRSWHFDYDPRFGSDSTARKNMYDWIKASYDGLVPDGNGVAIKTKGTGADPNRAAAGGGPRLKGWDGMVKGLIVPDGNGMAIKTKGTGADKNRVAAGGGPRLKGWDGTVKGLIVPDGNGVAIKTKGTGADPNRVLNKGWDGTVKVGRADPENRDDGFVTSATDPRGNVTTGSYDANGNRIKVQFHWDRQGTADWDFAYNANGQCVAIINAPDANGRRSVDTFIYYSNGPQTGYLERKIEDDVVGITTSYEYDARGNVTRVVDPRTNDWLYTYNSLDQCVRAQSPVNISARCATDYYYDANDNLVQCATQVRDAADNLLPTGQTDHFIYDGLDRLTQIALAVDATHSLTNQFVYDGNDQCVQLLGSDAVSGADPHQTVVYQNDERGLLFREIGAPGLGNSPTNEFSYDTDRRTVTVKLKADDGAVVKTYDRTFAYDGFGRLASATDPMGNQTVCFYDANDNLKVVRQFGELNDVPGSADNVRLAESRCEYDGLDRCVRTHELFFDPATQSPIGSGEALTTFAYAPNDECVSVTDTLGHTTTYGYDTACRLVSVTDALGNRQSVVYDACANPLVEISSEQPAAGGPPQVFSITNVYDSLSRCVSSTDSADNTSSCAYDSLDRFVRVTDPNGNDTTYAYDLLDNCLATTDYAGSSSGKSPTVIRSRQATFDLNCALHCFHRCQWQHHELRLRFAGTLHRHHPCRRHPGAIDWSPRSNLIQETDPNGTISHKHLRPERPPRSSRHRDAV